MMISMQSKRAKGGYDRAAAFSKGLAIEVDDESPSRRGRGGGKIIEKKSPRPNRDGGYAFTSVFRGAEFSRLRDG
jgi:hypothetical protein